MKLRFLQDARGSEDGLRVREFAEGMTEEVADELARVFLAIGAAEMADMETPETAAPAMETPEKPRRGRPRKGAGNA